MACFASQASCAAANGGQSSLEFCLNDAPLCNSGAATAWINNTWFFAPSVAYYTSGLALPNGGGIWCWPNATACQSGPCNASCSTVVGLCRSGPALRSAYTYSCDSDYQHGATPNAGGLTCYTSLSDCLSGANACSIDQPCSLDPASCSTGLASVSIGNWFCEFSAPKGALASGSGAFCYDTQDNCGAGLNACSTQDCTLGFSFCNSGQASQSNNYWYCPLKYVAEDCHLTALTPSPAILSMPRRMALVRLR